MSHTLPKLHNAAWPGVVGKETGSDQPPIALDTMLDLTAAAEVDGTKFEGVDLFLFDPHVNIDASDDELTDLADRVAARSLFVGTVVAPVWAPTGGGSAMGGPDQRQAFLTQVRKGCRIAQRLRELGIRPSGNVRIDSACSVAEWVRDPEANQEAIAETFRQACEIASDHGETLTAEGEICWGGMHSWRTMLDLLQRVDRHGTLGFQADMAHTLLYTLGYNAVEDRVLRESFAWDDPAELDRAVQVVADALRPWTNDFHVAQNDATVHGTGSHDITGRHCLATDPQGKLDIVRHAGMWLRDGEILTKGCRHICWDGCMFPNEVMMQPQIWQDILEVMVRVRDAHGWSE